MKVPVNDVTVRPNREGYHFQICSGPGVGSEDSSLDVAQSLLRRRPADDVNQRIDRRNLKGGSDRDTMRWLPAAVLGLLVSMGLAGCAEFGSGARDETSNITVWLAFYPNNITNHRLSLSEALLRYADPPEGPPDHAWEEFRLNDFTVYTDNVRGFSRGRLPLHPSWPYPAAEYDAIHVVFRNVAAYEDGNWTSLEPIDRACVTLPRFDSSEVTDIHLDLNMTQSRREGDTFDPVFTRATALDYKHDTLWDWSASEFGACEPH